MLKTRPSAATVVMRAAPVHSDLTATPPERLDASPVSIGGMDTSQEIR
jgi:hypothetical protein